MVQLKAIWFSGGRYYGSTNSVGLDTPRLFAGPAAQKRPGNQLVWGAALERETLEQGKSLLHHLQTRVFSAIATLQTFEDDNVNLIALQRLLAEFCLGENSLPPVLLATGNSGGITKTNEQNPRPEQIHRSIARLVLPI